MLGCCARITFQEGCLFAKLGTYSAELSITWAVLTASNTLHKSFACRWLFICLSLRSTEVMSNEWYESEMGGMLS